MTDEATEFRELYERHTGYVVEGNVKASLADMAPSVVPAVFEGVVPRGRATSRTTRDARRAAARWRGGTVYGPPDGPIGLRSDWTMPEGAGRAVELENLPVEAAK